LVARTAAAAVLEVRHMIRLRVNRIAVAVLLTGLAAVLMLTNRAAASPGERPSGFVVHEWGTFSTFSGSDGVPLKFYPDDRGLPGFVYGRHLVVKSGRADVYVSLETPVVYFYSDRDRTVSIKVDFPKGMMTDWYPQASRPPEQSIRWDDLKVLAKDRPPVVGEGQTGRYFASRETDAATVRTSGPGKGETERLLFYRGVGDFVMPFVVRAHGDGKFSVKNTGKEALPGYVLVEVKQKKVTFKVFSHLSPGTEQKIELPADPSTAEKLGDTMVRLLVEQGLYEKEARAMVKTWRDDWFGDEGTRVLYLVAEPVTNEFLPMAIDPKPDQLVRVLVGRHDVLTPEREREIDALVKRVNGASNADATVADGELNTRLGRYRHHAQKAAEARLKGRRAGR
jgi:hypothetical protein